MWRWIVTISVFALLLGGCAQVAQKAVEETTGVKVDQKGDSVTIEGKDGEKLTFTSDLPEEFKDFPEPPGLKAESSSTMSSGDSKISVVSWTGKGQYKQVLDFYRKNLTEKGWTETYTVESGDGGMATFSKGDLGATITFTVKEGGELEVSALLGKSKPTPIPTEAIEEDTPTPEPTWTPTEPEATSTPEPPATGDPSSLAPELKDIPVPSGFTLKKDGMMRFEEGGKFKGAMAMWFGKSSVQETGEYLKKTLPGKGWNESEYMAMGDVVVLGLISQKDETLRLTVSIATEDDHTLLTYMLTKD